MSVVVKQFNQLTVEELYEIIKLRVEVFVVEQNCPYQDLDEIDKEAYHVYIREEGKMVAYLRVIDKEKRLDEVSIGRVISLKRRQGLGTRLMLEGIKVAKEKFGAKKVKVGAQIYAQAFYESVGFRRISDEYLEEGVLHKTMEFKV